MTPENSQQKRFGGPVAEDGVRKLWVVEDAEAGPEDLVGKYLATLGGK